MLVLAINIEVGKVHERIDKLNQQISEAMLVGYGHRQP